MDLSSHPQLPLATPAEVWAYFESSPSPGPWGSWGFQTKPALSGVQATWRWNGCWAGPGCICCGHPNKALGLERCLWLF